jgi:hypothetical protein
MFDWIVRRSRRHIDVIQPRPKNMKNDTRATSIDSRVTLTLPLPFLGDPTYTFDFDAPIDFIFLSWTPFFFLSYPLSSILCSNADASNLKCYKCTCNLLYSMLCCVCLCARWKSSFSISLFPYILFHPPTVFISLTKCCCCFISYKFRLHPIWW